MTADSSSSRSIVASEGSTTRPQAGPLPTKRGEFGYRESLDHPELLPDGESESDVTDDETTIPARHPADRELPPVPPELGPSPITNASGDQPSAESQHPARRDFSLFRPRVTKQGVRSSTIFLLVIQGSLFLLTIALWIIVAELVLPSADAGKEITTGVFVHVTFVMCTVIQAVLLERLIFRYRAERYAMLHPGEVLPDLFNRGEQISTRLALAPWNRPPLPTYAAVLIESGVGTGDVEDNHIVIVPPPAYGHTRGSTLLLAGFISTEYQEQARLARDARGDRSTMTTVASVESDKSSDKSRPVSYITVDSEWNARCDMSRATYLAETLARLEADGRDVTTVRVVSLSPGQAGFVDPILPPDSPPSTPSAS
ncbi:hypothetical protein BJ322DRAFT_511130 [Thelephora terrestris]|uniref:Uncharacterized protein n=1 Tax=Thelephora terrestris TaxID=56493 RepID=A0A9P6H2D5_9AGAM|nr:hypothetical protein BJ322DRAFT_511130 [Thelephora terrestris]